MKVCVRAWVCRLAGWRTGPERLNSPGDSLNPGLELLPQSWRYQGRFRPSFAPLEDLERSAHYHAVGCPDEELCRRNPSQGALSERTACPGHRVHRRGDHRPGLRVFFAAAPVILGHILRLTRDTHFRMTTFKVLTTA